MSAGNPRLIFRLPADELAALRRLAPRLVSGDTGKEGTVSDLIREAIASFLARRRGQARRPARPRR